MDVYLGIDQSYSGFALSAYNPQGGADVMVTGWDPKKYGKGVDRLLSIEDWMKDRLLFLYRKYDIRHVCMEGYSAGSKFGREAAGELGAVVKIALREYLPGRVGYPTIVPPNSLKKFVLGKGAGKKQEMLLGVYKKWEAEFKDDNLADAYALSRLAEALHTGSVEHKYEREVLDKLTPNTERF